jgi:hypothetical protein
MVHGDGRATLLVRHESVGRGEIVEVLRRHWPDAQVTDIAKVSPVWNLGIEDAVELARAKRSVEPLRIVVMGQQCFGVCSDPPVMVAGLEPMPALF